MHFDKLKRTLNTSLGVLLLKKWHQTSIFLAELKNNVETGKFNNSKILKLLKDKRLGFLVELEIIGKNVQNVCQRRK